nr:MAG TPA: protein of unknown function DUF282 [Caudoviricetes sp.]
MNRCYNINCQGLGISRRTAGRSKAYRLFSCYSTSCYVHKG